MKEDKMRLNFIEPNMIHEVSERERLGRHLFNIASGAFELGYQCGIADQKKKQVVKE